MVYIKPALYLEPITIDQHNRLYDLILRIYPPAYKHLWKNEDCNFYFNKFFSLEHLQHELLEASTSYHFVISNTKTVGILRVDYNRAFPDNPTKNSTYLHRIYLGEEAQGKGIAHTLFDWVEQQSKRKGNTLVWLKAMDTQKQALRFYEKQKFRFSSNIKLEFELLHDHFRGMKIMYKNL